TRGAGDALPRPGVGRAGTAQGGPDADAAGPGGPSGDGDRDRPAVLAGPARGGVWTGRTGGGGSAPAGGRLGRGGQDGRARLRSRAASAARGTAAPAACAGDAGGRSLFPAGPGRGPPPAGQVLGAARRHEPVPPVAAAGEARRSLRVAGAHLRLVYRGV